jgi:hypothetical protein
MFVHEGVIGVSLYAICFLIYIGVKYYKQKRLFEFAAWPVTSPIRDLVGEIEMAESRYSIPPQYRINKATEQDFVEEILREYRAYILTLYFRKQLKLIKNKYELWHADYFMATLHDFLSAKRDSYMFSDHFLYRSKNVGNETKHIMTDFGIAFYKLYYIAHVYCKQHPRFNNRFSHWIDTDITNVLDTKEY